MMGVSGLAGDPAFPPTEPPMPPLPLGRSGARFGKAMNKLGWHWWPSDTTVATTDYEGRARCINLGHCTPACAQGAKASTDITYWPARAARRRRIAHALPGARDHHQRRRHGLRRRLLRQGRRRAVPGRRSRGDRLQRHRHAAAAAEFGLRPFSERARQFQRAGRQEPDVSSLRPALRLCRRAHRQQPRAADLPVEQGVLRDRPLARLRARLCHSSSAAASVRCSKPLPARPRACCPGARTTTPCSAGSTATGSGCRRSARICRKSTTASRSIRC